MSDFAPREEGEGRIKYWVTKQFDPWLETRTSSNTLIVFFWLLVAIPIIGIGLATTRTIRPYDQIRAVVAPIVKPLVDPVVSQVLRMQPAPFSGTVTSFTCDAGKSLSAVFSSGTVSLTLSDGRHLSLPQSDSSGMRYGNPDGSFIFFNGTDVYVAEGGLKTYTGCVVSH